MVAERRRTVYLYGVAERAVSIRLCSLLSPFSLLLPQRCAAACSVLYYYSHDNRSCCVVTSS